MFIYNIHVNGKRIFRICLFIMILLILLLFILVIYRIFPNNSFKVLDKNKKEDIQIISFNNYTNILRASYDDIDSYIGTKFKFTGYIYRLIDFNENEFVLARDMKLDFNLNETYVVGFLCEYKKAKNFGNNEWVEITGEITKGKYHNQNIPLVKILEINKCNKPNENELYVSAPDKTYIPTIAIF